LALRACSASARSYGPAGSFVTNVLDRLAQPGRREQPDGSETAGSGDRRGQRRARDTPARARLADRNVQPQAVHQIHGPDCMSATEQRCHRPAVAARVCPPQSSRNSRIEPLFDQGAKLEEVGEGTNVSQR